MSVYVAEGAVLDPLGSVHFALVPAEGLLFLHWRRKWQPTPVFLPGESQRRGSLVGLDKNTGVGSHSLLQGIFPIQGLTTAAATACRRCAQHHHALKHLDSHCQLGTDEADQGWAWPPAPGSSWGLSTTHIAFPAWRVMLHWLDTGRTFLCRGLALEIP